MNRVTTTLAIAAAFAAGCGVTRLLRPAYAAETIAALSKVMLAAGVSPTNNLPPVAAGNSDYQNNAAKKTLP